MWGGVGGTSATRVNWQQGRRVPVCVRVRALRGWPGDICGDGRAGAT